MFDVTSRITYKEWPNWRRDVQREWNNVLKNDIRVKQKHVPGGYIGIDVRQNYNLGAPFIELARQITGDRDLYPFPEIHRLETRMEGSG